MKILTTPQIRQADAYTIQHTPISSIDLMERAATACADWITERYSTNTHFNIICGTGNNGGDGLAIARLLAKKEYPVSVFIIHYSDKRSADFISNYERLKASASNVNISEYHEAIAFQKALDASTKGILIDALFGTGLNKPVEGLAAAAIQSMNAIHEEVIAIDVPSGMYGDTLNEKTDAIVTATYTLTFQFPKLSFMLPENVDRVGELEILEIGLHKDFIDQAESGHYYVTHSDAATLLKKRSKSAHKGTFGHSLLVAGSYGKMGAAVIASRACLRTGTGLLTTHVPQCGYNILQTALPEAMLSVDPETNFSTDHLQTEKYNAIGIGPGIGQEKQTQNVLKMLIQETRVPLVIDADALNILSENKTWLAFLPANSILTPHPKEFERLAGKAENSIERLQQLREFCIKNKVYVVLKGAHTATGCPDGMIYFNSTGNPGMAKGGSGDALTGMITALLAQRYSSLHACILGVYLHGLAGDFAAHATSMESMMTGDLIESISDAFNALSGFAS